MHSKGNVMAQTAARLRSSTEPVTHKRRRLITGAAAAFAALLAWVRSEPKAAVRAEGADDGTFLRLGTDNRSMADGISATTRITAAGGSEDGALKVTNTRGRGVVAVGGPNYHGVLGVGVGVAAGVRGEAESIGVQWIGWGSRSVGESGTSRHAWGVWGKSEASGERNVGVRGDAAGPGSVAVQGNAESGGAVGVHGQGVRGVGVLGQTEIGCAVYGISTHHEGAAGLFHGPVWILGDLTLAPTSRITQGIDVDDGTTRQLVAPLCPEGLVEDVGVGVLMHGRAAITLDPTFADLLGSADYVVMLTPEGECEGLYVASKTTGAFLVRDTMVRAQSGSPTAWWVQTAAGHLSDGSEEAHRHYQQPQRWP
jgi:hypothetical protein